MPPTCDACSKASIRQNRRWCAHPIDQPSDDLGPQLSRFDDIIGNAGRFSAFDKGAMHRFDQITAHAAIAQVPPSILLMQLMRRTAHEHAGSAETIRPYLAWSYGL